MPKFELFGTAACPYTAAARDWLEWNNHAFIEYDVEADDEARRRMQAITGGQRTVPVIAEDGRAIHVGWQGRGCVVTLNDERL